jgi:hypothetical protein
VEEAEFVFGFFGNNFAVDSKSELSIRKHKVEFFMGHLEKFPRALAKFVHMVPKL